MTLSPAIPIGFLAVSDFARARAFYEGILGLDHKEALPLLHELLEHATEERFQYRHVWKPGDLVLWDNRCLLHKANGDYDMDETRYLYRVMLQGDVPR